MGLKVAGKKPAAEIRKVLKKYGGAPLSEIGTNERGDTLFAADWAKWYEHDDCFPEVDAVMNIIDKYDSLPSDKSSNDTGIEYCRVGEEDSDTEYRANGDCYGYLSVGIRVDGGVDEHTCAQCRQSGADILVAGSAFFKARDKEAFVAALKA